MDLNNLYKAGRTFKLGIAIGACGLHLSNRFSRKRSAERHWRQERMSGKDQAPEPKRQPRMLDGRKLRRVAHRSRDISIGFKTTFEKRKQIEDLAIRTGKTITEIMEEAVNLYERSLSET